MFILPSSLFSCFQIDPKLQNISVENDSVRGRLTYEGKPIADAPVHMWDSKGKLISKTRTSESGWFDFPKVAPGKYKVALIEPSGESFVFIVSRPGKIKTVLLASFWGDWCREVQIVDEITLRPPRIVSKIPA